MPNKSKKRYTEEQIDFVINLVTRDKSPLQVTPATKKMCSHFKLDYDETVGRAFRGKLQKLGVTKNVKLIEQSEDFKKAKNKTFDKRKRTFVIGYAQNATPVHKNLFLNMLAYAEDKKAGLHIIAGRYKNPTSIWSNGQEKEEWWANEVLPYLDANRHNLHEFLQILSDVKISPTASTPLSGLNGITGLESCVVGHTRQHLKSLPVLEGYPHKLLLSTGACTVPNYTDSKAGKKGEFHHMLGFIVVELDGEDFHIRQINSDDDGNFYDLHTRAVDGVISENIEGCDVAILGDVHVRHNDAKVTAVAFKLIDILKPKHTIVHDIAEMESILHWDEKDPFRLLQKEELGLDDLKEEIDQIMAWIEGHKQYSLVMARSNHDDMLDRWLKGSDWRKIKNKKIYLELSNILASESVAQVKGVLPFLIDKKFGDIVTTLSLDDSFRIHGWELAMHGHLGANGSRGGHTQFKNLNTKNATGHGHHPHREDGHVMVGTLSYLRVGFNRGPSNWMNGLGLIYPDGKFQLIHIINGKYCK
jgi:hypothetical protein